MEGTADDGDDQHVNTADIGDDDGADIGPADPGLIPGEWYG